MLLTKDNLGMFVGHDGKVTRQHGMTWSEVPHAVSCSYPYAMGLLPAYIEVGADKCVVRKLAWFSCSIENTS